MNWLTQLFGDVSLPEIKTDVGEDIDRSLKRNVPAFGFAVFIGMLVALVVAHFIIKKIG